MEFDGAFFERARAFRRCKPLNNSGQRAVVSSIGSAAASQTSGEKMQGAAQLSQTVASL